MNVHSELIDYWLILKPLAKRFDASEVLAFKTFFFEQANKGYRQIALDFGEVEFVDSSGLGCLVSCLKHLGTGGVLVLFNPNQTVRKTFKLSRMDKVLRIFDSRESVMAFQG